MSAKSDVGALVTLGGGDALVFCQNYVVRRYVKKLYIICIKYGEILDDCISEVGNY